MRWVTFEEIHDAQEGLVFQWTLPWLTRLSYYTRAPLKFVRECGRGSVQKWRTDDLIAAAVRRYGKSSPEAVTEFALRLNAPVRMDAKKRAKTKPRP
jgi:hypothetical protein